MNKYEKLNQIKECISKIEEDLTLSYNNDYPDKEAIMTKNILECLKNISGLIEDIIDEPSMNNKKAFFITNEQADEIILKENATIGNITDEINRVTETNNTSKITTTWITDWLLEMYILQKDAENNRISTRLGNETGITTVTITKDNGSIYFQNRYSAKAQKFIYDNIENIIDSHYNGHQ